MREIRTSGLMRGEAAKTPPLLDSPPWPKETAKETTRRSSLDLRAGNVSARSGSGEEPRKRRSRMDDVYMLMLLTRHEHGTTPVRYDPGSCHLP
jgi:hypothetical protein